MPYRWNEKVIKSKELKVHNGAGAWSPIVDQAIATFNQLSLPVTLKPVKSIPESNVYVKMSSGNETALGWATANFGATRTHGQAVTSLTSRDLVHMVVIFLPEKLANVSNEVKMAVAVHELLHSTGLVEKNDHDPVGGILFTSPAFQRKASGAFDKSEPGRYAIGSSWGLDPVYGQFLVD